MRFVPDRHWEAASQEAWAAHLAGHDPVRAINTFVARELRHEQRQRPLTDGVDSAGRPNVPPRVAIRPGAGPHSRRRASAAVGLFVVLLVVLPGCALFQPVPAPIHQTQVTREYAAPTTGPATQPVLVKETTTETTVAQPKDATVPAQVTNRPDGTIEAKAGAKAAPDEALATTKPLVWAGIGLCIAGVAMLILKSKLPLVPAPAGFAAMALGAAFIAAPVLIDRYSAWVFAGAAVLLLGGMGFYAWRSGWFDQETGPEAQTRLADKGQREAAGALAYVNSGGNKQRAKLVAAKDTQGRKPAR